MTWAALLLADPSPCLRWLALRDILGRPEDDAEMHELAPCARATPWSPTWWPGSGRTAPGWGWAPVRRRGSGLHVAGAGAAGLPGLRGRVPTRGAGAEYLWARQETDGRWPLASLADEEREGARDAYTMKPLQTAQPLQALAACGYAQDTRAERAYEWLLAQRLEDGAWPTGIVAGVLGGVGGYRRLAHSRWGCRSSTTAALAALALHPRRRHEEPARRALDLLLGRETREEQTLGFEVARTLGVEEARGSLTHFARFDLAQVLDLCTRTGLGREDDRVADLVAFVSGLQGAYGLWEYGRRPQVSRWVTLDLLRSLSALEQGSAWVSREPRTPFQPYPQRPRRY